MEKQGVSKAERAKKLLISTAFYGPVVLGASAMSLLGVHFEKEANANNSEIVQKDTDCMDFMYFLQDEGPQTKEVSVGSLTEEQRTNCRIDIRGTLSNKSLSPTDLKMPLDSELVSWDAMVRLPSRKALIDEAVAELYDAEDFNRTPLLLTAGLGIFAGTALMTGTRIFNESITEQRVKEI